MDINTYYVELREGDLVATVQISASAVGAIPRIHQRVSNADGLWDFMELGPKEDPDTITQEVVAKVTLMLNQELDRLRAKKRAEQAQRIEERRKKYRKQQAQRQVSKKGSNSRHACT